MLAVGDKVESNWTPVPSTHTIKAVHVNRTSTEQMNCQSGILVQVSPALKDLSERDWIDIGWFKKLGE